MINIQKTFFILAVKTLEKGSNYAEIIFPLTIIDPAEAALLNVCQIFLIFYKII